LLNVLVTRAKREVHVCTSIPQEFRATWEREIGGRGNTGKGIVYAYLEYARAVTINDLKLRSYILDALAARCSERYFAAHAVEGTESPFEEEVVQCLLKHIPEDRIMIQHSFGGFRIDVVLKSIRTNRPLIAIEADGAKYHSSREAHVWDVFRQKQLESFGFKFYRIWSSNWWKDREGEVKKLRAFIRHVDEQE
jgi:very-short-patch-repair endonuclease